MGTTGFNPSSGGFIRLTSTQVTRIRPLSPGPDRALPTALGVYKLKAPRLGHFGLTERFERSLPQFNPVTDALGRAACSSAFSDAGLFHRDASLGNVMIGLDNEGRLNDWDLCRGVSVDKSLEGPRAVRGYLYMRAPMLKPIRRGPGSSYRPGYSSAPDRSTH